MTDAATVAALERSILAGDITVLTQLVVARHHGHGDGVAHFDAAIRTCLDRGAAEPLRALDGAVPGDSALKFYTHYAMAFVAAWTGDVDETSRRLREVVRIGLAGQATLAANPSFEQYMVVAAQQAIYIDPDLPLVLPPGAAPPPAALSGEGAAPLLVMASCNGRYFDRFAEPFTASALACLPAASLHLHVANPTSESRRLMAALAGRGRVSFSEEALPEEPALFACARFLVAADLMRERRCDLLVSDIDALFTGRSAELGPLMAGQDAGLFERHNASPMELCHCPLSYFRYGGNALLFLSLLGQYIRTKLADGNLRMWMLDQCALFVVSRRAMAGAPAALWRGRPPFRWADLGALAGEPLTAFQTNQAMDLAGKNELRDWSRFRPSSIDQAPDGRVSVR